MESALGSVGNLIVGMVTTVLTSLAHNWWVLLISIVLAVALKTYVDTEKLRKFLTGRARVSILMSVAVGAFTPFCACGTMAVIIGMLITTLPWGPIMAFLTSSPLMSPDGFLMISGLISFRFAVALTIASLVIGAASGFATQWIEKRTGFLLNQARFQARQASCGCEGAEPEKSANPACGCAGAEPEEQAAAPARGCAAPVQSFAIEADGQPLEVEPDVPVAPEGACCAALPRAGGSGSAGWLKKARLHEFLDGLVELGLKQILMNFCLFIGVGYLVNAFVPESIVSALLGANSFGAVPLASVIGLPLYLTTESSIPVIQSLLQSGASEGAMLAFIISGSATSAWVIAGLATFMRKRALGLYVAYILLGSMLSGFLYDLIFRFL